MSWRPASRAFFGLLFAIVTWLTVTPNPDDMDSGFAILRWLSNLLFSDSHYADKIAHFLAYGALGASAGLAELRLAGRFAVTALALALYGAALEGVQGAMGVRSPELSDAFANAAGAAVGVLAGARLFLALRTHA